MISEDARTRGSLWVDLVLVWAGSDRDVWGGRWEVGLGRYDDR